MHNVTQPKDTRVILVVPPPKRGRLQAAPSSQRMAHKGTKRQRTRATRNRTALQD